MTRAYWSESAIDGRICATYEVTGNVKAEACIIVSRQSTSETKKKAKQASTTAKKESKMKKLSKFLKKNGTVVGLSLALLGGSEPKIQTNVL